MASPSDVFIPEAVRLKKLEKQNRILALFLGLSFVILLILSIKTLGPNSTVQRLDARSISLRDPHGRVIAEIGSEPGMGTDKDLYRPFIRFQQNGNEPTMTLYGAGIHFREGEQWSNFNFLGIQVYGKDGEFTVNRNLLSYLTPGGQLLVLPKKDGMNLTVSAFEADEDRGVFGVLTGPGEASMYVAGQKNEIDINADSRGTHVVRGKSQ